MTNVTFYVLHVLLNVLHVFREFLCQNVSLERKLHLNSEAINSRIYLHWNSKKVGAMQVFTFKKINFAPR